MNIPVTKILDFDPNIMQLGVLNEFQNAFKDSVEHKIADIPFQYMGLSCYKMSHYLEQNHIQFIVNAPTVVYIAIRDSMIQTIPEDYMEMMEELSVLNAKNPEPLQNQYIWTKDSYRFKIYSKKYNEGLVEINFQKIEGLDHKELIIFYHEDSQARLKPICAGLETLLSLPSDQNFLKCTQSSKIGEVCDSQGNQINNGLFDCESAFSGKMSDDRYGMWSTNEKGLGSWIEIRFKQPIEITKFDFLNREDINSRAQQIKVTFGPKVYYTKRFKLKNKFGIETFGFKESSIISDMIRFEIEEVYTQSINGLAVNVYGMRCQQQQEEKIDENLGQTILFGCRDNLINKDEFKQLYLEEGMKFKAACPSACLDKEGNVYGHYVYSVDSVICKSAAHAGMLTQNQYQMKTFMIVVSKPIKQFVSSQQNLVKSKTKKCMQNITMVFNEIDELQEQPNGDVVVGQKVDVLDKRVDRWIPCLVESVQLLDRKLQQFIITVSKDGVDDDFFEELKWPQREIVDRCGIRVKKRNCKTEQNSLSKGFIFGNGPLKSKEYILDNGQPFGYKSNGLTYGWSRNNTANCRARIVENPPEEYRDQDIYQNLVLFAPDPLSKWCLTQNQKFDCEFVYWSIEVENGKYKIEVTSIDVEQNWQNDIIINDQKLIPSRANRIIKKGELVVKSMELLVIEKKIVVQSRCQESPCLGSWSRMNELVITKLELDTDTDGKEPSTSLECGVGQFGGNCDRGCNVENCLWNQIEDSGISECKGGLKLIKVPSSYQCKDQVDKFKCVKTEYTSQKECLQKCPASCNLVKDDQYDCQL